MPHLVRFPCFAFLFFCRSYPPWCCPRSIRSNPEAAGSPRQSQFGHVEGVAAGAGHWPATADKFFRCGKSYGAFKTVDDLRKYRVAGRPAPCNEAGDGQVRELFQLYENAAI
jgi:hypothetical protein